MKFSRLLTMTATAALMTMPAFAQSVPGAASGTVGIPYSANPGTDSGDNAGNGTGTFDDNGGSSGSSYMTSSNNDDGSSADSDGSSGSSSSTTTTTSSNTGGSSSSTTSSGGTSGGTSSGSSAGSAGSTASNGWHHGSGAGTGAGTGTVAGATAGNGATGSSGSTPNKGNGNAGQPYTAAGEEQRDANQQDRIEAGLKDGQLSTQEASQLEHGEAHIDAVEAKDMSNGNLTAQDRAQLAAMQNRESARIAQDTHNNVTGNPNSPSDKRMQADVQRDAHQEQRIDNGLKNGSLTNREAGHLERGQAFNDRGQWRAGRDGHIGARQQHWMQARENHTSRGTFRDKHNRWDRG